jgi:hypothetical protein
VTSRRPNFFIFVEQTETVGLSSIEEEKLIIRLPGGHKRGNNSSFFNDLCVFLSNP